MAVRTRILVAATIAAMACVATRAAGQDAPSDVPGGWSAATDDGVALPEPPHGYLTERRGEVEWSFPAAATSEARALQELMPETWARIEDDLGTPLDGAMVIRVARDPEEMRALAPVGIPPPAYASGVAYPRYGVILLSLTAPETWQRPDMDALLAHELSHLALHRAVEGRAVPRWFSEGLAVYQAGEFGLERAKTLWSATVAGNVVPLGELDRRFPDRPHRVNVAYAQSADFVAFLRSDVRDERSFRILIRHLREGMTFRDAVSESYGATLGVLENDWRVTLSERFQTIPLVVTGGGLWTLMCILLVYAWARRRRRTRQRLDEWAKREAAEDEALARAERAVAEQLRAREESAAEPALAVPDDPPQGREPEVPTIEYEGRNHTLH